MPNISIPYLLNEKLNILGRKINCKVVGEPGSENDNQPYILIIPGGPGFGLDMYKYFVYNLVEKAKQEGRPCPHYILYDPLGCGESDSGDEYTVDHFTEMDANLVETIKRKLNINKMNLSLVGRSFGHMVAMNFPIHRREWLLPTSDIHLQKILSIVGANGEGNKAYALNFLEKHYSDKPNYQSMLAAEKKLFAGQIQNTNDYIKNFVIPMAPAYSPETSNSLAMRLLLKFLGTFPGFTLSALKFFNKILQKFGKDNEDLTTNITTLTGCSFDVLNQFFKTNFGGFDTIKIIRDNLSLYQKISIALITSQNDHMVDPTVADKIHKLLPNTSCEIAFTSAHIIRQQQTKELYNKLNYDFLMTGKIDTNDLHDKKSIAAAEIPEQFRLDTKITNAIICSPARISTAGQVAQTLGYHPAEISGSKFKETEKIINSEPARTIVTYDNNSQQEQESVNVISLKK